MVSAFVLSPDVYAHLRTWTHTDTPACMRASMYTFATVSSYPIPGIIHRDLNLDNFLFDRVTVSVLTLMVAYTYSCTVQTARLTCCRPVKLILSLLVVLSLHLIYASTDTHTPHTDVCTISEINVVYTVFVYAT